MKLLLLEIWFYLLIAFLLGMFVQWFFCCRNKHDEEVQNNESNDEVNSTVTPVAAQSFDVEMNSDPTVALEPTDDWKPFAFAQAPENRDELKRIKGIGAVIEKTLNDLGIYTFEQIAKWTPDNVSWVENYLAFPGRIGREDWISQANTLAGGGNTEFSQKVDKGEVEY